MAQDSWPSPGHNARAVTDAEYEQVAAHFSDDGVYGSPADTQVVTAGTGLTVTVDSDVHASVRGHAWTSGSTGATLPVTANASGQTRIDRVVLRLDRSDWTVRAVVKDGTPGSGAPPLTRTTGDTGTWEVLLATVTVLTGAASVSVTRAEVYVGTRVRPCLSTARNPYPERGELAYETNTGRLLLYTGTSWIVVYEESSELILGAGYSTWTDQAEAVGQRSGSVVSLRISKRRAQTNLLKTDPDGSKVAVVPSALRPARNQFFGCTFSNRQTGRVEVLIDGGVWVNLLSGDVTVGHTLTLTMTYLI